MTGISRFVPLALSGALVLSPMTVCAEWEGAASVALTSDYVFRGVSQTDEDPALQGSVDLGHESGLYLGAWASNVDFDEEDSTDPALDDAADLEVDLYLGYANAIGELDYDITLIRYSYPGADADLDYNELILSLGYAGFVGTLGYSNDIFASDETGLYYRLDYAHEFDAGFTVSAGAGYTSLDENVNGTGNPDSYVDYHLGIAKDVGGFSLDLSWYDTNSDGEDLYGNLADSRVVLTVSKGL